ncbi:choice-of-anchor M domain-containing protein [Trueperella pecoris]|uniref:choice-of-anchor M domain-containing protein n=1 Tax=Trueperella pecoris TaxID=2733571 RepID=UPI001ABE8CCD|nr:choice-of-anchor M domain-containing protein [Trueperella pecoris]QTG75454.1 choice-of-anchor M domain-containing protein [Trueperella pecoris]
MRKTFSRSAKLVAAALATSLVALTAPAHADTDRTEFRGGHIDAFYVYNRGEETSVDDDGNYKTTLHLDLIEDVTAHRVLHKPEQVRLVSVANSYTCFDKKTSELFKDVIPNITGAYVPDSDKLQAKESLNPGYSRYVSFPDPEEPASPYVISDVKIKFSNVEFPDGGSLIPYEMQYNFAENTQKPRPVLEKDQYAIQNESVWSLDKAHEHAKWLITKPGTYKFSVTATAEFQGQTFTSKTEDYEWVVEPSDLEGSCDGASSDDAQPVNPPDANDGDDTGLTDPDNETTADPDNETTTNPDDETTADPDNETTADPDDETTADPDDETTADPDDETTTDPEDKDTSSNGNSSTGGTNTKPENTSSDAVQGTFTLDRGHADVFNVVAQGNKLVLNLKEDVSAPDTIRKPEDVVLKVSEKMRQEVSAEAHPGIITSGYLLPQEQETGEAWPGGTLWPGWETLQVRPNFSKIDITFDEVSGPGRVQIFSFKGFGKLTPVLANKSIDLESGSVIPVPEPTHVHTNWLFEKPGIYTMKVKASGKDQEGKTVTSNTATYTWHVGDFSKEKAQSAPAGTDSKKSTDAGKTADTKKSTDAGKTADTKKSTDAGKTADTKKSTDPNASKTNPNTATNTASDSDSGTGSAPETSDVNDDSQQPQAKTTSKTANLAHTGSFTIGLITLSTFLCVAGAAIMLGRRDKHTNR